MHPAEAPGCWPEPAAHGLVAVGLGHGRGTKRLGHDVVHGGYGQSFGRDRLVELYDAWLGRSASL
jgi:hypothetical protein